MLDKLRMLYSRALNYKTNISSRYDWVAQYTDTTTELNNTSSSNKKTPEFRDTEVDITTSISKLVNFIMNSMFARGDEWATIKINDTIYETNRRDEATDTQNEVSIKEINETLEKQTSTTFTYINQSNFYKEVARSLRDSSNLGTGCIKIIERDSKSNPFTFKYINQNNFYFLMDDLGEVSYVFKKHLDMTEQNLKITFGDEIKIPNRLEEVTDSTNIFETVCFDDDTDEYIYTITDESFSEVLLETRLNYNPFIVFRWDLEGDLDWGIGLGIKGLTTFKKLRCAYELREKQAKQIVYPPLITRGDRALSNNLSLEPGANNYGGDSGILDITGDTRSSVSVEPITTTQRLLELDQDIIRYKQEINDLYMSDPLGNLEDYKNRSATETQARMQMMRGRWANSFEMLQDELLEDVLINAYKIMIKVGLLKFEETNFEFTDIQFINELSKLEEQEKVNNVMSYIATASQASQATEQVGLKTDKTLEYLADQFNIPEDMRMGAEEIVALQEQQRAFRQQLLAQQQLVNEGVDPNATEQTG